ncbi:hypothetical protein FSP39_009594, partial [Pinctada imbricata]
IYTILVLDAEGKPPSGIMGGNLFWPGDYYQCLSVKSPLSPNETHAFQGRYCIQRLIIKLEHLFYTILICIEAFQFLPILRRVNITIKEASCYKPAPWTKGSTGALSVFAILACLVAVGTIIEVVLIHFDASNDAVSVLSSKTQQINYDEPTERTGLLGSSTDETRIFSRQMKKENKVFLRQRCRILTSFSLIRNTKSLVKTKTASGHLSVLDGMRVLSMWWVILGHTYVFIVDVLADVTKVEYIRRRFSFQVVNNATLAVDTFFFISGLLVAYLTLNKMKSTGGKVNWILFYVHRIIRLTPVYALVLLFFSALLLHTLSGPIAAYLSTTRLDRLITMCYTTWWANLLYINNFYPHLGDTKNQCLPWSWYLANDMQFYIISPIFLIILYRNKRWGISLVSLVILACIVTRGALIDYFDINYFTEDVKRHNDVPFGQHSPLYNKPFTRIAPYFVGVLSGYVLYQIDCTTRLKKIWILIGWFVAIAIGLLVVYGPYREMQDPVLDSFASSLLYGSLSRFAWGVALAWVVFACSIGCGGPINAFLSLSIWKPLGRLTYSVYLVHPIVIYYHIINSGDTRHYSDVAIIWIYVGNIVMAYAAAYVVSMMIEAPILGLEKQIRDRSNTQQ